MKMKKRDKNFEGVCNSKEWKDSHKKIITRCGKTQSFVMYKIFNPSKHYIFCVWVFFVKHGNFVVEFITYMNSLKEFTSKMATICDAGF